MNDLLEFLYNALKIVFEENLKVNDKKIFIDNKKDVFRTYMSLGKSQKEFRFLIEQCAIPKEKLIFQFSSEVVTEAIENKFVRFGQTINDNKLFITSNGLFQYYMLNSINLNDVFIAYDKLKFPNQKLKLKSQEKIWCLFLMLLGADSEKNVFDTTKRDSEILKKYFSFFKVIENELKDKSLIIGKNVGWGNGKDTNFRNFITNAVDLPKTGIYFYPSSKYWLDLSSKKNTQYILNLILDSYNGEERVYANKLLDEAMFQLSNKLLDIGEIPPTLNKFVLEVLRG